MVFQVVVAIRVINRRIVRNRPSTSGDRTVEARRALGASREAIAGSEPVWISDVAELERRLSGA